MELMSSDLKIFYPNFSILVEDFFGEVYGEELYKSWEILNEEQRCNFLGSPSRELLDLYASSIDSEYSYSKRQRNYDIAVSDISDFELRQDDKVMVKKRLPAYSHDLVNIAGLFIAKFCSREKINIPIYQTEDNSLNIANLYPKKYWFPISASFNGTLTRISNH